MNKETFNKINKDTFRRIKSVEQEDIFQFSQLKTEKKDLEDKIKLLQKRLNEISEIILEINKIKE